jgi:3-hydroxymyristoyl/3-hydroxydecanoyl-(acyl carrier protein) dehydratase
MPANILCITNARDLLKLKSIVDPGLRLQIKSAMLFSVRRRYSHSASNFA